MQEMEEESSDGAYGNYGLTDQRAVMQWIQRNIRKMGGDPDIVSIFGQSAGAWSVCQHLVSPGSSGTSHLTSSLLTWHLSSIGP